MKIIKTQTGQVWQRFQLTIKKDNITYQKYPSLILLEQVAILALRVCLLGPYPTTDDKRTHMIYCCCGCVLAHGQCAVLTEEYHSYDQSVVQLAEKSNHRANIISTISQATAFKELQYSRQYRGKLSFPAKESLRWKVFTRHSKCWKVD